jgi:hypothetical protein
LSRAAYFRKQAETCRSNAALARDDPSRLAWSEMAAHWHRLAEEVEPKGAILEPPPARQPEADDEAL